MSTRKPGSAPKADDRVEQLLREGIALAKIGDKAAARTKLQEVVSLDQYNEKGWYWLASVVETDEERRVCLGNVVVINPDNERAQRLLDQLARPRSQQTSPGASASTAPSGSGAADGIRRLDRRVLMIVGGIVGVACVLLAAIFALGRGGGGSQPIPTVAALAATEAPMGAGSETAVASSANGVATGAATGPATVAPTFNPAGPPTLPPAWTPTPLPTRLTTQTATPLAAPPPGLTGHLVAMMGTILTADKTLPLVLLDLSGKPLRTLTAGDRGDFGFLTPDGQRVVYSRYLSGINTYGIRIVNLNGGQATELNTMWNNQPPLSQEQTLALARSGRIVFSAINLAENDSTPDIYYLPVRISGPNEPISTPEPPTRTPRVRATAPTAAPQVTETQSPFPKVVRVTAKDSGVNTWPTITADGKLIAFVGDTTAIGGTGIDIYVVPSQGGTPKNLTADLPDTAKSALEWSPDGSRIAFQVTPKGAKTSDIYVMKADGSAKTKLVSGNGDNIRPHWSPDGKYIAFSSTRTGKWEIFVVEVASGTIYQVTSTKDTAICTSWGV